MWHDICLVSVGMRTTAIVLSSVTVISALCVTNTARADAWNEKTDITFSVPVEIPGHVLEPGTYVFKIVNATTDRNIVEVYNKKETHWYGTFLTIPDYRLRPVGKAILTFDERAPGSPEAVLAWFYPGDTYGHVFVYPKSEAVRLAKANSRPVASMPDTVGGIALQAAFNTHETSMKAVKETKVNAVTAGGQEVDRETAFGTVAGSATAPVR